MFYWIESCRAGYGSVDNDMCKICPEDTYKNMQDGSKCKKCGNGTTTAGKRGSTQCRCELA